jgi:hypothetical protein
MKRCRRQKNARKTKTKQFLLLSAKHSNATAPAKKSSTDALNSGKRVTVQHTKLYKQRGRYMMYDSFCYKNEWRPYYTLVLDIDKLEKRIKYINSLGFERVTKTELFRRVGYSKSYACLLSNVDKYGLIEISARFIATCMKYLVMSSPLELFSMILAKKVNNHQQDKAKNYEEVKQFKRHTEDEEYTTRYYSR